ncbi:MAG TPA: response regulator [Clostridia bacterium]|nr:response regulator [Clostridia bacterium]
MYRVFIADDEPSVIEGLKIMVPWNELDFELCGEASNGREALAKIEKLRPHLVITDIRMPLKSGLELINDVRKLGMSTEYVILSGYSEFAYAREAIRHHVSYYMLKPLDRDEIITILETIKNKLDKAFLACYGFSQADIDSFRMNRGKPPQEIKDDTDNPEGDGILWRSVRENFDEELMTALKLMNYEDAKKLIDEMFDFFKSKRIGPANVRAMVNSCVYRILHIAFERNIKLNTILPQEPGGGSDFDKLKNHMTKILSQTISLMLEDRRKNSRSYLYEVKDYLDKNFDRELSVSYLAEMVFMEAGYLGDAFSKQFGCSVNEYQHRLRIDKAIELINSTDMKLSDISAAVGYNNYNNFFAHFERITHKKPTQYGKC